MQTNLFAVLKDQSKAPFSTRKSEKEKLGRVDGNEGIVPNDVQVAVEWN
ncbi:MAG TPA: hypothetical protein VMW38_29495 [Terriglobia bacterium]|nr:hypothetical protein [Terriglobia bacterium]